MIANTDVCACCFVFHHRRRPCLSLALLLDPGCCGCSYRNVVLQLLAAVVFFDHHTTDHDCQYLGVMGGGDQPLITPDKALPGRSTTMANIEGLRHYVLGNKLTEVPEGYKVAIFANGCFWGSEKGIWRFPFGIHSTAVGYCGGFTPNPTYEEACSGQTGHTEGVRVVYDPNQISFVDILRWFWEAHDPASGMGQGNDRGSQYRSGFYYLDDEQQQLIVASKKAYETALGMDGTDQHITTEIAAATDYDQYGGLWYFGEPYHQHITT